MNQYISESNTKASTERLPLHLTWQECNEKGIFFRTNGKKCKITKYKGSFENIIIPDYIDGKKVVAIDRRAFMNTSIKNISLPNTINRIEKQAFYGCSLVALDIPLSVHTIKEEAFSKCNNLKKVQHNYVYTTYFKPFFDSTAFTDTPFFKESKYVLLGNVLIKSNANDEFCELPTCVSIINDYAFSNSPLKYIHISECIKRIGSYAFSDFNNLVDIIYPRIYKYIVVEEQAFVNTLFFKSKLNRYLIKEQQNHFLFSGNIKTPQNHFFFGKQPFNLYLPFSEKEICELFTLSFRTVPTQNEPIYFTFHVSKYFEKFQNTTNPDLKKQLASCLITLPIEKKLMEICSNFLYSNQ